jgi:hypothetical protein
MHLSQLGEEDGEDGAVARQQERLGQQVKRLQRMKNHFAEPTHREQGKLTTSTLIFEEASTSIAHELLQGGETVDGLDLEPSADSADAATAS